LVRLNLDFASIGFCALLWDMKLRTKLNMADCQTRLKSSTDLRGLALSWDTPGPGPVLGEFRGPVFRLHTRKYYSNSFVPFFYGKLTEVDDGSILEGGFRMNPVVRLFMVFWFSFLLVFAVGAIMVPAPAHPAVALSRGWLFAVVVLLAILGVALVLCGRWLGRDDQQVIHSFLKGTLEASEL
jgi:hypothetical protein